jgi:hypothetical protein
MLTNSELQTFIETRMSVSSNVNSLWYAMQVLQRTRMNHITVTNSELQTLTKRRMSVSNNVNSLWYVMQVLHCIRTNHITVTNSELQTFIETRMTHSFDQCSLALVCPGNPTAYPHESYHSPQFRVANVHRNAYDSLFRLVFTRFGMSCKSYSVPA